MTRVLCINISGVSRDLYERLYAAACEARRVRADRYRRTEDALRCVTADALLRYAVRQTLGISSRITEYAAGGKPYLREAPQLHYNLSHSGDWVVIAFGETEVGIDVEKITTATEKEAIAQQFFTKEEQQYIFHHPQFASHRFFQVWTGKESYLKFLGTGLHRTLDSFSILSPAVAELLHSRILDGGYYLTVCSTEPYRTFEFLNAEQLI